MSRQDNYLDSLQDRQCQVPAARPAQAQDIVEIDSASIFGSAKTVAIRHGDQVYTLRVTRADKLLLTK